MDRGKNLWRVVLCALTMLTAGGSAWAQKSAVASRVVEAVDDTKTVVLKGNVHPLAQPQYDQGALADSQPMTRMMLLLQRSPAQDLALKQLLDAQQTKTSGSYHAWLTPEQFGAQFGPSDADVQAVTDWLTREGFQVAGVAKGKTVIEFSGNAGQVRNAFHTEIHRFAVNGKEHFANVSDPAIPEALSPVVAGVVALHNFEKHPFIRHNGLYRRTKGSNQLQPLFTYGSPANYALGPGDFNTIYNIPSTATGAGQSIAVIAQTNINTQDIANFRSMFNLPAYTSSCTPGPCLNVMINGTDPGILGPDSTDDEVESDLDTEWSGAVAPAANIYLIVTEGTLSNPGQVSQGVDLSALFAVDNNVAPIISYSYGACEFLMGTAGLQYYYSLWQQAAAQGISVSVAAGDNGPAACDPNTSVDPNAASQGVAVAGTASTPFNVAVGGTDFDPSTTGASVATYWKPNTSGDVVSSAIGYIPEITWDDSTCAYNYPAACNSVDTSGAGADISAGSGGPSNCATFSGASCAAGYPKPAFQTALTPADTVRDIPDISFFASNGGPLPPIPSSGVSYVICQSDTNPQGSTTPTGASCNITTPYMDFSLVGGTSAATPAFAAVMALVDQATNQRQGNPNYVLYSLAGKDANYTTGKCVTSTANGSTGTPVAPATGCIFNDVNKGNNSVACDARTPNCSNTTGSTSSYGVLVCGAGTTPKCSNLDNGQPAFQSGTGYDLATGLGSINVGNLLAKWASATRTATTTTLSSPSGGSPSGTAFTATIAVSPAPTTAPNAEAVSLIALDGSTPPNVLGSLGPFTLNSSGSASVSTNLLPPGTAAVEGTYGGDATLAASTSAPVALASAVTGASQASTLMVYFVSLGAGNVPSNPTTNSQNFQYGVAAGYILKIVVTGPKGSCSFTPPATKPPFPCPTGTVKLLDNGSALNDFLNNGMATNQTNLNNQGFAEDQPILLNAGTHAITATYGGDPNYTASSSSNTLSVTVTQAATSVTVSSSATSIMPGTSVTLTAVVNTQSFGNGPTGTVQFTSNGSVIGTPTCTPTGPVSTANGTNPAYCTATLTAAISSLYPPPTTKPGTPAIPRMPALVALLSLLLFFLGMHFIPQTRRRAYACAGLLVAALLVGVVSGCGGGSGGGGGGGAGTRTIGANYSGDVNYTKSAGTTSITVQ
jgi:subtilase family serine protease